MESNSNINLTHFIFEKALVNYQSTKTSYILGHMKGKDQNQKAILKLQKTDFNEKDLPKFGEQDVILSFE